MDQRDSIQQGADRIKESADRLAGSETAPATVAAQEIALMSARLDGLAQRPPQPRTSDFNIAGPEVPFPAPVPSEASVLERIIDQSDLLPVWFLEQGVQVQRSVARVVLTKVHVVNGQTFPPGTGWATGFLVAPTLLLTNNHVIPDAAFASKIKFQFNFQLGADGGELSSESFLPDAASFFHTNAALDYSLIRVRPNPPAAGGTTPIDPGARWGVLPLVETPILRKDQLVNIIQHPAGRRKEVALQNNKVDKLFQNTVRYTTDTEPGSSGSPVFDNLWQLAALHHAGGDVAPNGTFVNNEGIRLDPIVADLRQAFPGHSVLTELGI
jgi:V8-like Glu-specific endopeptidase